MMELTSAGDVYGLLRECLSGQEQVIPFTIVSFRLLSRIADVLMYQMTSAEQISLVRMRDDEIIERMKEILVETFDERVEAELGVWPTEDRKRMKKVAMRADHQSNHKQFTRH